MKVAVSIPQATFNRVERFVKASGRSRSDVYASAIREYVARHEADDVTETLDHVIASLPAHDLDARSLTAAARRILESAEW